MLYKPTQIVVLNLIHAKKKIIHASRIMDVTNVTMSLCENNQKFHWGFDAAFIIIQGTILLLGIFLNGLIALVLLNSERNPVDVFQLHQSIGGSVEGLLSIPMFFYARYCVDSSLRLAVLLFKWQATMMVMIWTHLSVSNIILVILRTVQICQMRPRKLLSPAKATWLMGMIWVFTATSATLACYKAYSLYFSTSGSNYSFAAIQYVTSVILCMLVSGICNMITTCYLKRYILVGLEFFAVNKLKWAKNTLAISYFSSLLTQVKLEHWQLGRFCLFLLSFNSLNFEYCM